MWCKKKCRDRLRVHLDASLRSRSSFGSINRRRRKDVFNTLAKTSYSVQLFTIGEISSVCHLLTSFRFSRFHWSGNCVPHHRAVAEESVPDGPACSGQRSTRR